jgi:hypothetical protein
MPKVHQSNTRAVSIYQYHSFNNGFRQITYRGISVNSTLLFGLDKEAYQRWDERKPIAYKSVIRIKLLQTCAVKSVKENEINVHCHCQRPPRVRLHEPVLRSVHCITMCYQKTSLGSRHETKHFKHTSRVKSPEIDITAS